MTKFIIAAVVIAIALIIALRFIVVGYITEALGHFDGIIPYKGHRGTRAAFVICRHCSDAYVVSPIPTRRIRLTCSTCGRSSMPFIAEMTAAEIQSRFGLENGK
jgi:hypothetical protein